MIISIKFKFLATVYKYCHDLFLITSQALIVRSGQLWTQTDILSFPLNPCDVTTLGSIIVSIWHCPGSSSYQTDCLATSQCPCPHLSLDGLSPRKHQDLCPSFISMSVNDILAEATLRERLFKIKMISCRPAHQCREVKEAGTWSGWSRYQSEGERSEYTHSHLSHLLLELLSSLGPRPSQIPVHIFNFPRFFLLIRLDISPRKINRLILQWFLFTALLSWMNSV